MKKMNVKSILHTSFVIMVALTVFIGSIGIYSVNEMTKRDRAMVDYTPVVYSLGLMMEYFQKINAELYQLAIWSHYGETGEMNKIGGNIESYIEIINAAKDEYLETSFDEVLEWNFYEAKRIFEDEYLPFVSEARLSLGKAGGLKAAVDIIVTGAGHYERLEELWNASIEDNIKWHYDEIIANENVARIALRTQAGAVSFSIVASVFFAIYLSRRIKKMDETIKAQAEHIENENERMRILLDTSPVACRLFNKKYEIFECNGASIKLFQLRDKQEFMADYYNFSPEYQPDGQSSLEKAKLLLDRVFAGEELVVDWLHQLSDGTLLPSEITLRLARYGGEEVVAGYTRDLREQNRMLGEIFEANEKIKSALIETQNANDAKSSFLASMSHEMRTPLNAIIGLSGLRLENGGLDDETASYLERINSAGGMLLKIVNDILDISKIEAGKMELVEFDYDVPSLINDAVTQNFVRIGEKQIELQLEIDESVYSRLFGDELRVKQIMNNLLSNAIKYTEEGTVRLSFECARVGGDVWVSIRVSDTGIGIKKDDIGGLFDDYAQMDSAPIRKIEGTGLGLPIANNLAKMMSGEIKVESEYGVGSVFTARLKQRFVSDVTIGPEAVASLKNFRYIDERRAKDAQFKRISLPYARVLIVDDNVTNLDVSKGLMLPYGMHIDCVPGGRQAVEAIRDQSVRYNAVFMDHMMPGMDGIEATRIIREEIGTDYAKTVPIIALTANAITGNEELFLSKGFQAFITKPVEIAKLDEIIRRFIRDKEQEKQQEQLTPDTPADENILRKSLSMPEAEIPGIDIPGGVRLFGGDEAAYMDVLRSYAFNTRLLFDKMNVINADALADYAIIVHGIKGSSRSVNAAEAGNAAEALERAAKDGNLRFVEENSAAFIESLRGLLDSIDAYIAETEPVFQKSKAKSPDRGMLEKLLAACECFDTDEIDDIIGKLNKYEYEEGGEAVAELTVNANKYDFNSSIKTLYALLGRGETNSE